MTTEDKIKEFLDEEFPEQSDSTGTSEEINLPESPASVNIRFWADEYGVMFTMRDVSVNNLIDKLKTVLETIKDNGWKPTWDKTTASTIQTSTIAPAPKKIVCPVHGTEMRYFTVKKDGTALPYGPFYKCTQIIADGTYCKEKYVEK